MCSSLIHIQGFLNVNGYPVSHRSVKQSCDTMFIYPSTYSFYVTYSLKVFVDLSAGGYWKRKATLLSDSNFWQYMSNLLCNYSLSKQLSQILHLYT